MRVEQRGFTLIELLVAIAITAIMVVMGYRSLDQALKSRTQLDEQSARINAVQQALRTLEQDFELLQPRPVRNLIGDGYLPALTTSPLGTSTGGTVVLNNSNQNTLFPIVSLTRAGWTNPAGIQRSELQRVTYAIKNNVLIREYTSVLDATEADVPVQRALLDRVKSFSLRFMDASHTNWSRDWPTPALGTSPTAGLRVRPIAVEVTLELDDLGVIVRHVEIAG